MDDVSSKAAVAANGGGPPAPLDRATIHAIMSGILLAMFLSALEQTIVAPALPTIGRTFGDVDDLSWVVTAYLLAATAATPLFGKLSDIHGRRHMLLAAILVFIAGSVACALAPSMAALIAGRALQGLGGGGILPIAQTVIGDMVSPLERPRYQATTSIMFMVASVVGPLLGGVLTDYLHWTMIFWINLPMGALALWMTNRALKKLPRHDRPHKLDVLGALLMVAAAITLMLAMNWGGTRHAWSSAPILGLLAGSVVCWLAFALRVRTAPEPFIPLDVLGEPIAAGVAAAAFCAIGTIIGLTIFLPIYFELVLGFTPSGSGTALIVFLAGMTAGSYYSSRLVIRLTHYKLVPMGGLVLGIAMLVVFAVKPDGLSLLEVCVLLTVGGAGVGVMYPVSTIMIQNTVSGHRLGIATGALNFARQLGGAMIVAAFSAIVLGGIDTGGHGLTLDALRGAHARGEFAQVFRYVFEAGAVFLVVGLIALLCVEERPLRGPGRG